MYYSQKIPIFFPYMQAKSAVRAILQHPGVLVSQSGARMRYCGHGNMLHGNDPIAHSRYVDVLYFELVVFRHGHFFNDRCTVPLASPIATDEIEGGMLTARTLWRFGIGERDAG